MTRGRAARTIPAAALVVGAVLALLGAPHQSTAGATSAAATATASHRAAVVVDLGNGRVKVGCVSFSADHLTGLEALDRASMAPVAQTYGGQGSAVCALCGQGCTAGSTCLTCKAPNYWAYYHDGTYSSVSASRTQVRDGDVESWKWGKGERPASVAFDQVCLASDGPRPTPAPTSAPVVTVPPSTPRPAPRSSVPLSGTSGDASKGSTGPAAPTGSGGPGATTGPATTGPGLTISGSVQGPAPSTTTAPGTPPRSTAGAPGPKGSNGTAPEAAIGPKVSVERAGAGTRTSAVRSDDTGHSSVGSIIAFAAVIAGVGGLLILLRRRRASAG